MTERYIYENNSITDTIIKETIELTNYDEIINLLNQKENQLLHYEKRINELTTQLQTEEESVCIKCKHHYLINYPESSKYYISKCKKEHEECSKEDIRFCEDFEFELEGDVE